MSEAERQGAAWQDPDGLGTDVAPAIPGGIGDAGSNGTGSAGPGGGHDTGDSAFDRALVGAVLAQAAARGWRAASVVEAAREAALPLDRVRARAPTPAAILLRFGAIADGDALRDMPTAAATGALRDRLFDLLMRRFDTLQEHRGGILAVLEAAPRDPALALMLAGATARSMGWMLEAAGGEARGLRGAIRVNLVVGAWLYATRAWQQDESLDLSSTMAALDRALDRLATLDATFARDDGAGDLGAGIVPPADAAFDAPLDRPFDPLPGAPGGAVADLPAAEPPFSADEPPLPFPGEDPAVRP